jgi:hypothetical protein
MNSKNKAMYKSPTGKCTIMGCSLPKKDQSQKPSLATASLPFADAGFIIPDKKNSSAPILQMVIASRESRLFLIIFFDRFIWLLIGSLKKSTMINPKYHKLF